MLFRAMSVVFSLSTLLLYSSQSLMLLSVTCGWRPVEGEEAAPVPRADAAPPSAKYYDAGNDNSGFGR